MMEEIMKITRRRTLKLGAAGALGLGLSTSMSFYAFGQTLSGDRYEAENGEIVIMPVAHASFVMSVPGTVIYVDPIGGPEPYANLPAADLVLITHEHDDHYHPETLAAIVGEQTAIITNPAVHAMLADDLKSKATALANGETTDAGEINIEAIPAYNTTEDRLQYHPKGRDNGYVLSVAGRRIYIAGDTEDIPEMRALTDIDIAFVPMNLPYTMTVDQASDAVAAFKPAHVYPYHHKGSDIDAFAEAVKNGGSGAKVVLGKWYE